MSMGSGGGKNCGIWGGFIVKGDGLVGRAVHRIFFHIAVFVF